MHRRRRGAREAARVILGKGTMPDCGMRFSGSPACEPRNALPRIAFTVPY